MDKLVDEILKLSLMKVNQVIPIYQGEDVVYLNRSVSGYAIAIPFNDDRNFDESFVGITLSTNMLNYEDKSFKVLFLNMIDTGDLKKFSYIGADFIDIKNRESLLNNPYSWVDIWKEMFGDSKKKYMITDVLAELVSLKILYENDKSAKWVGPEDGTHDIVLENGVVEVKSTTHKTNSYVSINSRFQIDENINEELFFVRLEPKPYATSIDSLVNDLIMLGYDSAELEAALKEMGYKKGNRTRKITYNVLGVTSYPVNEDTFPIIKLDDLNSMIKSKNIVGFKLTLDLSSIEGKTIF